MSKINLFCLPFAGGSKYAYTEFQKLADNELNVIPIELPGRGNRYGEKLLIDVHEMTDDIFEQIKDNLKKPYAIYGHSMGTLLGYLLVHEIVKRGHKSPVQLFFTGRGDPSVKMDLPHRHSLPKEEFRNELKKLGGSPDEVLNNPELMNFFEPILRADFQAIETYEHEHKGHLNIPITVIIGTDEKTTYEEAKKWENVSTKEVEIQVFPGGHFFIFQHSQQIIDIIIEKTRSHERRTIIPEA